VALLIAERAALLIRALTVLRKRQAADSEAAGTAYEAGLADLDWYTPGDQYVITDELGMPAPQDRLATCERL
jgi:hypothetical protein